MSENEKILQLVDAFEQVFEDVIYPHEAHLQHPVDETSSLDELLRAARIQCLPLAQEIDASVCMSCDHFVGCHRAADGSVVLRCWTHESKRRLARGTAVMNSPRLPI